MLRCESGNLTTHTRKGNQYYLIKLNLIDSAAHSRKDKYKTKRIDTGLLVGGKTGRIKNENLANEMLTKAIREYTPVGSGMKFSEYAEYWFAELKKRHDIELTTKEAYAYKVGYITGYFADKDLTLAEVEPSDIRDFLDYLYQITTSKGKPLADVSIRDILKVAKQIFQFAQENGHLFRANPCATVKMPKVKKKEDDLPYIGEDQVEDFKSLLHEQCDGNEILEYAFLFGLFYGLRRSEICGLRWSAIRNGDIHIEHTIVRVKSLVKKDSAKTDSSNRTCAILPEIQTMFDRIREIQAQNKKLFGNTYIESDYVFTWQDGRVMSPDYLSSKFRKIIKKSETLDNRIHLHDLRVSCVSILVNSGINIKDVSKWVGHSNVQTTMNIYARTTRRRQYQTGEKMASVLFST